MKTNRLLGVSACILFFIIFMAANVEPQTKLRYTPYQILMWEIKANEGYRSWWYRDGTVQNRIAHSIGFGWNDCGNRRRKEIAQFTKDGKVTFDEAMTITLREIEKYGKLHSDPYKNLALQLYSYNCGLTKKGSSLGHCCHSKKGCGSPKQNVRKSHNRRRQFELALWNHRWTDVVRYTEQNKTKLQTYLPILKSRGEYQ